MSQFPCFPFDSLCFSNLMMLLLSVIHRNICLTYSTHFLLLFTFLAPSPCLSPFGPPPPNRPWHHSSPSLAPLLSVPRLHYSHSTDLPQPLCQTDGDQPRGFVCNGPFSHQPPTDLRKQQGRRGQKGRCRQGAGGQKDPKF